MHREFISLAIIAIVAAATPIIARLIPKQIVPETVILILAGALLGPNMAGFITSTGGAISLLSDLGCAFLFLMAGYEINPKSLSGTDGRHGLFAWCVTFAIAFVVTIKTPMIATGSAGHLAVALLLTTTALGALMPILKERKLMDTREGGLVVSYGTWGELCPVLAMALLLSARAHWLSAVLLAVFFLICVLMVAFGSRMKKSETALYKFLKEKSNTTSQTTMRIVVLILILLVTFSAVFDLDIVLGAFAAGFVIRMLIPAGAHEIVSKLDGMAYGFFVPLFFVVSGCEIDIFAVGAEPLLLVAFILGLILVRCVPIAVSLSIRKSTRGELAMHSRLSVSFYCTTALPLIVAITSMSVDNGIMTEQTSSVLIAAGAISMFLMPLLGSLAYRVADAEPIVAVMEIANDPGKARAIIARHIDEERQRTIKYRHIAQRRNQKWIDALDVEAERVEAINNAKQRAEEMKKVRAKGHAGALDRYRSYGDGTAMTDEERLETLQRVFDDDEG